MKSLLLMILVSFSAFAWNKLSGYPESLYATQGELIESNFEAQRHAEIAYAPESKLYGITFYNFDTDDRLSMSSAGFNIRACGLSASGEIKGIVIVVPPNDYSNFTKIVSCRIMYVRVYEGDNSATYRFDHRLIAKDIE
ncbi:hypothetical protein KNT87_gp107 [Erwinia phage Cronus]|uniref:Uncharacterized protein n=1 Tax=Erwinia phage Cronus TaxID=2163633 RepID=A0A2S1GMD9_9CAUD|nr:hypothetical protein KNT87_gp107 [Erwinia phage Cronus]AWD90546.1 hypothetical protein [Erwinia phage Cronus]